MLSIAFSVILSLHFSRDSPIDGASIVERQKSLIQNGFTNAADPPPHASSTGARLVIIDLGSCAFITHGLEVSKKNGTPMYTWEFWVDKSKSWSARGLRACTLGGKVRDCFAAGVVMLDILRGVSIESLESKLTKKESMTSALGELVDAAFDHHAADDKYHPSVASIFRDIGQCSARKMQLSCALRYACICIAYLTLTVVIILSRFLAFETLARTDGWEWPESFITANKALQKYLNAHASIYNALHSLTRMRVEDEIQGAPCMQTIRIELDAKAKATKRNVRNANVAIH